jgi:hypothetical protein
LSAGDVSRTSGLFCEDFVIMSSKYFCYYLATNGTKIGKDKSAALCT